MVPLDLAGTVAIVTGAGQGIGQSISVALGMEGARVVLVGRRGPPLEATAEMVRHAGGEAIVSVADVRHVQEVGTMVARTAETWGPPELLVNNAGYGYYGPITELPEERWEQMLAVNLSGVFHCVKAVLPYMQQARRGQILNVGSVLGTRGAFEKAAYCATKYGLHGFSEALQLECAPFGVRVMTICPGTTETRFAFETPTDRGPTFDPEEVARGAVHMLRAPLNVRPDKLLLYPLG